MGPSFCFGELSGRCAESLLKFAAVNQKEGKMAMEGKMSVIKYLMFFFNVLFWLSGLALIIVGALIKSKYGTYLSFANAQYADAAIFIIVVGVIVFVVAFMGCCGAIKENYCMITTFATFMVIIFILGVCCWSNESCLQKEGCRDGGQSSEEWIEEV